MGAARFALQDPGQGSYSDASSAAQAARQYSTMAQQAADAAEQYAKSHGGTPPPPPTDGAAGGNGGGGAPGSGRFVQRSDSEIQRAYDAIPGPPTKGEILAPGPPSAPPAPPSVGAGGSAGSGAQHSAAAASSSSRCLAPQGSQLTTASKQAFERWQLLGCCFR